MILSVLTPRSASAEIVLTLAYLTIHVGKMQSAVQACTELFVNACRIIREILMSNVIHMSACKIQTAQLI